MSNLKYQIFKRTRRKIGRPKKRSDLEWQIAEDVKRDIEDVLSVIDLPHVKPDRIFCYRTEGSTSRSYARIWQFPKIFQKALEIEPAYVIEVLSKYYDKLSANEQKRVLIHELLHIPKNFSGALLPHRRHKQHLDIIANGLYREYLKKRT